MKPIGREQVTKLIDIIYKSNKYTNNPLETIRRPWKLVALLGDCPGPPAKYQLLCSQDTPTLKSLLTPTFGLIISPKPKAVLCLQHQ